MGRVWGKVGYHLPPQRCVGWVWSYGGEKQGGMERKPGGEDEGMADDTLPTERRFSSPASASLSHRSHRSSQNTHMSGMDGHHRASTRWDAEDLPTAFRRFRNYCEPRLNGPLAEQNDGG
ncbi:hypothetical protein GWK47_030306 [Chionoecetes opilio]|uniref:Uncharacterized protein n=1 Tax=Chionoecetes opilio TaxID=41210 RepID=A0A8J4YLN5_CHIOP|nr:hypothetical protein GWK47_030306 [Chionoecetes opilio]